MKASILIASFNRDSLLELNLRSLLKQNLNKKEIEILVINDGLDTVQTRNLVNKYSEKLNIKYIFSGKRNRPDKLIWRNPGFAYNYASGFSSGEYLFICGAEIYHENDTINLMLKDIQESPSSMVVPIGRDDRDGEYTKRLYTNNSTQNIKLFDLNTKLPFLMCIPRKSFFEINGYDEDMIGIGYDDDDIVTRLNKIGLNYKQSLAKITHLFHKRTPDNYVVRTSQSPKILHDKLVYLNNQIFNSKKDGSPRRNLDIDWGKNNIWYLRNIPKKIHFYWGDPNNYMSYLRYLSIYSAVQNNPDFEVYLHIPSYTSSNIIDWKTVEQSGSIVSDHNWFEEAKKLNITIKKHDFDKCGFSNERHEVQKSDFIRWIILFEFGGFWSDIDIFYSKSFYDLSCNVPENYNIDTGIHIYPDFKSHAIGFLFSSLENSFFKECHYICSEKFKNQTNNKYQSFGSDVLNDNFKTIDEIRKKYPSLSVINIDKDMVYRISPSEAEIGGLYSKGTAISQGREIGLHWFGGHPLSRVFEKNFEEFNQEVFNNKLSNYILKYNKKNIFKTNDVKQSDNVTKELTTVIPKASFIIVDNKDLDLNLIFLNFLNQTNKNFEIILISNHNIDIKNSFKNKLLLKHIKLAKDSDFDNKILLGIENSTTEYVSIIFENIILSENYIEKTINHLNNNTELICNNLKNINEIFDIKKDFIILKKNIFKNKIENLNFNKIIYLDNKLVLKLGNFYE